MRRGSLALLAAAALALSIASNAAAATDPFTRSWSATDFDGSLMTITFSGTGDTRTFLYRDERATTCGGGAYEASGSGTIEGDTITLVDASGGCAAGGGIPPDWLMWFTYQSTSDSLFDGTIHWYRGSRAHEAFLGVWRAADVDGSAMVMTFLPTGQLTRDVTFVDSYASSCGGGAFISRGEGTIGSTPGQGRFITLEMEGGCAGDADVRYAEKYEYVVATDTLQGPVGHPWYSVVWYR